MDRDCRDDVVGQLQAVLRNPEDQAKLVAACRALIEIDKINLECEIESSRHPENDCVDSVVIDSDPEIARLECELAARRAALGSTNPLGLVELLQSSNENT